MRSHQNKSVRPHCHIEFTDYLVFPGVMVLESIRIILIIYIIVSQVTFLCPVIRGISSRSTTIGSRPFCFHHNLPQVEHLKFRSYIFFLFYHYTDLLYLITFFLPFTMYMPLGSCPLIHWSVGILRPCKSKTASLSLRLSSNTILVTSSP